MLERLHHPRLSEEAGHVDEDVLIERLHLLGVGTEQLDILFQVRRVSQAYPPVDPAQQRALLVVGEISLGGRPDKGQYFGEQGFIPGGEWRARSVGRRRRTRAETCQPPRNQRDGEHEIDGSSGDRALGHALVGGRRRILGDGQAPGGSYGTHPRGTVGSGAGEHDAGRHFLAIAGERREERVDRKMVACRVAWVQPKGALVDGQLLPRRYDIDRIGGYRQTVGSLDHGHARLSSEGIR